MTNLPASLAAVNQARLRFGDFNGDGLLDVLIIKGNNSQPMSPLLFFNQGNGKWSQTEMALSFPIRDSADLALIDLQKIFLVDVNVDGRTDIYQIKGDGTPDIIYLSLGNGAFSGGIQGPVLVGTLPADVTSAGNVLRRVSMGTFSAAEKGSRSGPDFYVLSPTGQSTIFANPFTLPQLSAVTDGLGFRAEPQYSSLLDPSLYTSERTPVGAPSALFQFSIQEVLSAQAKVVSAVRYSNGIGSQALRSFKYTSMRVQVAGVGLIGFHRICTLESTTGVSTCQEYSQDVSQWQQHHLIGATILAPDGTTVLSHTSTVLNTTIIPPIDDPFGAPRYMITIASTVEASYDLLKNLLKQVAATHTYDEYANLLVKHTVATGPDPAFTVYEDNRHTYLNDVDGWHLGVLLHTDVTVSKGQDSPVSGTISFTVDPATFETLRMVKDEDNPDLMVAEDYQVDLFGNRLKTTVSGNGILPRTTTKEYSPDGRFLTATTSPLGLRVQTTWSSAFGGSEAKSLTPMGWPTGNTTIVSATWLWRAGWMGPTAWLCTCPATTCSPLCPRSPRAADPGGHTPTTRPPPAGTAPSPTSTTMSSAERPSTPPRRRMAPTSSPRTSTTRQAA